MKFSAATVLSTALAVASASPLASRSTGTCEIAARDYLTPDNGDEWSWRNVSAPLDCVKGEANAQYLLTGWTFAVGAYWWNSCTTGDTLKHMTITWANRPAYGDGDSSLGGAWNEVDGMFRWSNDGDEYKVITGVSCWVDA